MTLKVAGAVFLILSRIVVGAYLSAVWGLGPGWEAKEGLRGGEGDSTSEEGSERMTEGEEDVDEKSVSEVGSDAVNQVSALESVWAAELWREAESNSEGEESSEGEGSSEGELWRYAEEQLQQAREDVEEHRRGAIDVEEFLEKVRELEAGDEWDKKEWLEWVLELLRLEYVLEQP